MCETTFLTAPSTSVQLSAPADMSCHHSNPSLPREWVLHIDSVTYRRDKFETEAMITRLIEKMANQAASSPTLPAGALPFRVARMPPSAVPIASC